MGSYSEKGLGEGGKALLNVRRGQKMSDYALLIRPTGTVLPFGFHTIKAG